MQPPSCNYTNKLLITLKWLGISILASMYSTISGDTVQNTAAVEILLWTSLFWSAFFKVFSISSHSSILTFSSAVDSPRSLYRWYSSWLYSSWDVTSFCWEFVCCWEIVVDFSRSWRFWSSHKSIYVTITIHRYTELYYTHIICILLITL